MTQEPGLPHPAAQTLVQETPGQDGQAFDGPDNQAELPQRSAEEIRPQLEALLLLATEPVAPALLAQIVEAPQDVVEAALGELATWYERTGRGFQLQNVGGGWRYATRPEHAQVIRRWVVEGQQNKLSQAGLETLAVIAYMQPVSRSRVSAVRGVNVDGVVRTLLARGLVTQDGNDDATGAATLRTTGYFLERLGLASLADLPPIAPLLPEASQLEAELINLADPAPAQHAAGPTSGDVGDSGLVAQSASAAGSQPVIDDSSGNLAPGTRAEGEDND